MFAYTLDHLRGLDLAGTCPFEETCAQGGIPGRPALCRSSFADSGREAEFGAVADASAAGPGSGFELLMRVRRWRGARPYFRGHRPMVFACPRVLAPVDGIPSLPRLDRTMAPALEERQPVAP